MWRQYVQHTQTVVGMFSALYDVHSLQSQHPHKHCVSVKKNFIFVTKKNNYLIRDVRTHMHNI